MSITVIMPFKAQSASRPNWNSKGRSTKNFMPKEYRDWRLKAEDWVEDYLIRTNHELTDYLATVPNTDRPIARRLPSGKRVFDDDFLGYKVEIKIAIHTNSKIGLNPFPLATRSADLDNYAKAIIDAFFEAPTFKQNGFNDRWIQDLRIVKIRARSEEEENIRIRFTNLTREQGMEVLLW